MRLEEEKLVKVFFEKHFKTEFEVLDQSGLVLLELFLIKL